MALVNLTDVIVALLHRVTVVAGATVVMPLLYHCRLRPLQTLGFWRRPAPFPRSADGALRP
jgi:hypothetical protein